MKICFISTEIFAWGKYGGFGRATRIIAGELVKKGFDVYAVVPIREQQKKFELLDGIKVYGYPVKNPLGSIKIFKEIDADIYHSQEPSLGTYFAQIAKSDKAHIVTFRDTRLFYDWLIEFKNPSLSKLQVFSNFIYENNFLVAKAVRKSTGKFSTADFISNKAIERYKLSEIPGILRSPVIIKENIIKSKSPEVVYLGRLDKRKRPERFFELAEKFPEVKFNVIGKSRDKDYNDYLLKKYSDKNNLIFHGFVDQFKSDKFSEILGSSWILINTALREGLPNSFVEALGHKCAILSSVDPDNFATNFGVKVSNDEYESGLKKLLENNLWKIKGESGFEFIKTNYNLSKVIDDHINVYESLVLKYIPGN